MTNQKWSKEYAIRCGKLQTCMYTGMQPSGINLSDADVGKFGGTRGKIFPGHRSLVHAGLFNFRMNAGFDTSLRFYSTGVHPILLDI